MLKLFILLISTSALSTLQSKQSLFTVNFGSQVLSTFLTLDFPVFTKQYSVVLKSYNISNSPTYAKKSSLNLTNPSLKGELGEEIIKISESQFKIPIVSNISPADYFETKAEALISLAFSNNSLLAHLNPPIAIVQLTNGLEYLITVQERPESLGASVVEFQTTAWEFSIDGIIFGSYVSFAKTKGKISLDEEYILGPRSDVEEIFKLFLTKYKCDFTKSLLSLHCPAEAELPDIYLNIGEIQITIPRSIYQNSENELKITYRNTSNWTFGIPFLKVYSIVMDYKNQTLALYDSHEFVGGDGDSSEDVDNSIFSTKNLILIAEILAGCVVIFILAKFAYGCCMTIEFSPPEQADPLLIKMTSPRQPLSPRR